MFDEFDDTEIQIKDDDSSSDEEVPGKQMGFGRVINFILFLDLYKINQQDYSYTIAFKLYKKCLFLILLDEHWVKKNITKNSFFFSNDVRISKIY